MKKELLVCHVKVKVIIILFLFLFVVSLPITLAAELTLIYDSNGNLITGDGKYREYNEFNQLVRVREGDSCSGKIIKEYIRYRIEDRTLTILATFTPFFTGVGLGELLSAIVFNTVAYRSPTEEIVPAVIFNIAFALLGNRDLGKMLGTLVLIKDYNYFSQPSYSPQLDQITQIINYGDGRTYNSQTGTYCDVAGCYSTAFPESYESSPDRNDDGGDDDYCLDHSAWWC